MWLDPTKNYDYVTDAHPRGNGVLQGDHKHMSRSVALRRGLKPAPPDRLLHARCNRARGVGLDYVDDQPDSPEHLSMDWPW